MANQPTAFISYRRSDAQQAALGLNFQLKLRFGSRNVFMDVGAIQPGDIWPDRLRRALRRADVALVLIGPGWLAAGDPFGRRRLDQPDDWVRQEIEFAIREKKTIIPLLIGGLRQLPSREGLPVELQSLLDSQAFELRDANWDDDIKALATKLSEAHAFVESDTAVTLPDAQVTIPPLSEEELDAALESLPEWEPVESYIPRDYPRSRQELRRAFRFSSFEDAVAFMSAMVELVNKTQHHPRLQNQWRTVLVHFTTWDIGQRISPLDVKMAREIDALYLRLGDTTRQHRSKQQRPGSRGAKTRRVAMGRARA